MTDEQNVLDKRNASREKTIATKKIILVAEDDEGIGTMLVHFISDETSYQVQLVSSGREALRVAREVEPALFLLDYHLPSMTGIQLYDQFQTYKDLKGVPTIMMSANLPRAELEKRKIIGLKKPFDLDELLELIERSLG
ncbi:MAG: response regulator [Ktedonobacteraceae bacterium]